MRESEFWARCRKSMPAGMMARRIEDRSGNLGTYDLFLAMDGRAAWLELKVAGPNAQPAIRSGQPAFGRECFDAGVPSGYLVGSSCGHVRLLSPLARKDTWRDHLVASWDEIDMRAVWDALHSSDMVRAA